MTRICLIVLMQFIGSCNQKAESETYLIPAGFTGKVNILFDKDVGAAKEYEGTRRVYKIPSDGILVTQFKINDGFTDREYYYIENTGKRMKLQIFKYDHNPDGTIKWIVADKDGTGIFLDGTSGQYGSTGDTKSARYQEFVVSSYNQLNNFYTEQYQNNFDSKIEKTTGLTLVSK